MLNSFKLLGEEKRKKKRRRRKEREETREERRDKLVLRLMQVDDSQRLRVVSSRARWPRKYFLLGGVIVLVIVVIIAVLATLPSPQSAPGTYSPDSGQLTTAQPSTKQPSPLPTARPTQPTFAPTTSPSSPTTAPTALPTMAPTASPTSGCDLKNVKYFYDGSCNTYNERSLKLTPAAQNPALPSVGTVSNMVFGASSNVDRGRSKLTVLAIAYARFFLFDVLEVLETDTTRIPLTGCAAGNYSKINDSAVNFQTPVMDLSNVFGTSDAANSILKSAGRLKFSRLNETQNSQLGYAMISQNNADVYVSGSPNSNVDHFSVYIHSRFFHLHTKFVLLLQDGSPNGAIFEAARVFVVMIAETIARDLVKELGTLPVEYDVRQGIPNEFLLMPFFDRFPDVLPTYGDVVNRTDDLTLCDAPSRNYNTTLYNNLDLISDDVDANDLSWVGYAAMYTSARNGGFLTQSNRCSSGYGMLSNSAFDPIASLIQRGRDHQYPSCESYRAMKNLSSSSFVDFGNDQFSRQFSLAYAGNFSRVDLSVCLLLDSDLRDRMMGSLILGVLNLQNSTNNCAGEIPKLKDTPVSQLDSFIADAPATGSNLEVIAKAVCRNSPKLDLRALAMIDQLALTASDSTLVNLGPLTDRFIVCTTAHPILSPQLRYQPSRSIIKEGNPVNCDWKFRDPNNNETSSLYLANGPRCFNGVTPTPNFPQQGQARRCFCAVRDNCFDRGFITTGGVNTVCTCDAGFNRVQFGNTACERMSYPQTPKLHDQYATWSLVNNGLFQRCSAIYNNEVIPVPLTSAQETLLDSNGYYGGITTSYCNTPTCDDSEGYYLIGACNNNRSNSDANRIGAALDRVARPNYPNGKSFTVNASANFTAAFQNRYQKDSTEIPQSMLFRGMGKLLLDDMFRTSTAYFNETGLRTGSDPSNPAQFKNTQTGWLDLSVLFPTPATYDTTTRFVNFVDGNGRIPFNPQGITDQGEFAMILIWFGRYNQIIDFMQRTTPCSTFSGGCAAGKAGRCARAITILEYQSVAREFLREAKAMNFSANWTNAKFDPTLNVPVEVGAARLFDLHLNHDNVPRCNIPSYDRNNVTFCVQDALLVKLQKQIAPSSSAINDAVNFANALGINSLNAYLRKLGMGPEDLDPTGNILFDLHGSRAEYAFNFGFLESILDQDLKTASSYTRQVCLTANSPLDVNSVQPWNDFLTYVIRQAVNTTLCKVIQSAVNDHGAYSFGLFTPILPNLHPNLFRNDEPLTGSC